jgi:predicted MFS family arabinose efflux permease
VATAVFRSPLAVLVGTVALLETLLLSALAPLLPLFEDDLGLSKAEVGVLNAAYPFGTMVVALPAAYLAARIGLRAAVAIGLVLLAASTLALGLTDVYAGLVVARFVQGAAGGGIAWPLATAWLTGETPPARRGRVIGGVVGISIFGATFGPVLGAVATADRAATFVLLSVVVLGAILLLGRLRSPAPQHDEDGARLGAAMRNRDVLLGLWFVIIPGALFGMMSTLLPLQLDRLGVGAAGIAAVFVASAALGSAVTTLTGRVVDRRGRMPPLRLALVLAPVAAVVLPHLTEPMVVAVWAVLAVATWDLFWPPAISLLSHGADEVRVEQTFAFAIQSMAWGPGAFLGSAGGGVLAETAGDAAAWTTMAVVCLLSLPLVRRRG